MQSISLHNLQIYCDYDCETYLSNGHNTNKILSQFHARWKHEIHTSILMPFDLEIAFGAEIKKKTVSILYYILCDICVCAYNVFDSHTRALAYTLIPVLQCACI